MFDKEDYKPKKSDGMYLKFKQGANKFRILTDVETGFVWWTQATDEALNGKPVRVKNYPDVIPANMKTDSGIKETWVFKVWDYADSSIKIAEITQSTIQREIFELESSEEWGDTKGYDLTINRTGEKLGTKYSVQPSPHKELAPEIKEAFDKSEIDLKEMWSTDKIEAAPTQAEAEEVKPF